MTIGPYAVTGANGFVGQRLVRLLVNRGETVSALVRRPETLATFANQVRIVSGDIRDPAALERLTHGARTVLHLAACAKGWLRDDREFFEVNVQGVRNVLAAAGSCAVARIVHVSTVLTVPPYRHAPVRGPAEVLTPYEVSKREGEAVVERYIADGGHAVIVHPTRVYGPGPLSDANAVTKAIQLYLSGRLRVRLADSDALSNYVHVDDVAQGILLAAARGTPGAHYMLGGSNAAFTELLAMVDDLTGRHRLIAALSPRAALGIAYLAEWLGLLGGTPPITRRWVRVFLEDRRADIEPTRRALGYAPRDLRTGLAEVLQWLAASGYRHAA